MLVSPRRPNSQSANNLNLIEHIMGFQKITVSKIPMEGGGGTPTGPGSIRVLTLQNPTPLINFTVKNNTLQYSFSDINLTGLSCKSEMRMVLHLSFKMVPPIDINNSTGKISTGTPSSSRSPSHGKQCAAFGCMSREYSVVKKMWVSTGIHYFSFLLSKPAEVNLWWNLIKRRNKYDGFHMTKHTQLCEKHF